MRGTGQGWHLRFVLRATPDPPPSPKGGRPERGGDRRAASQLLRGGRRRAGRRGSGGAGRSRRGVCHLPLRALQGVGDSVRVLSPLPLCVRRQVAAPLAPLPAVQGARAHRHPAAARPPVRRDACCNALHGLHKRAEVKHLHRRRDACTAPLGLDKGPPAWRGAAASHPGRRGDRRRTSTPAARAAARAAAAAPSGARAPLLHAAPRSRGRPVSLRSDAPRRRPRRAAGWLGATAATAGARRAECTPPPASRRGGTASAAA